MMKASHIAALILSGAALLAQGCSKQPVPSSPAAFPICFAAPKVDETTKTVTNASMPSTYKEEESFKVFAAYSSDMFDPSGSFTDFWNAGGLECSYNSTYNAWSPSAEEYYWPIAGYLSFYAYSPAGGETPSFSWTGGFRWNDFTIPAAGSQYDLLYTDLISNKQRSDYSVVDGNAHDDDPDHEYIYNGVNIKFKHALSLIQVQACSALGSYSSIKYYIQKVVLHDAYNQGTFTSNNETWNVNTGYKTDYTLLDLSGEAAPEDQWQMLPGSDEYPASVHPDVTLMLLPQDLDSSGAYFEIVYKCSSDNVPQTTTLPLSGSWGRSEKHTYKLVFSADIEFQASISAWDDDITYGSCLIVQ